jgi:Kef-type K+ transport system membrane component KefB
VHEAGLLSDIGTALVAATVMALLARLLRQPLILGYLAAGVLVGPEIGLGLVSSRESIQLISEIGLILLLFIIGIEMDVKKLAGSGRPLILAGLLQVPLCFALGMLFARGAGFALGGGRFDAGYVALAMALSSTMIVVKLLYDKFELMTLPGRITLGVLVFQDVWAILALAVQPTLLNPSAGALASAFVKGFLLVGATIAMSRWVLPRIFAQIAKQPELLLVTALAWCFLVAGAGDALGLSREMGALIAGVALAAFPYSLEVIAKVVTIRDFFVTLFFVALGMQIPRPSVGLVAMALLASFVLVLSRFATIPPVLAAARTGFRTSILPAINLSQMSEFSLVIAALGMALGHVEARTVAVLTFVFVLTSVGSTYMITYSHELHLLLARLSGQQAVETAAAQEREGPPPGIVLLGFFRDASSILHQFEFEGERTGGAHALLREMMVIDFNPVVLEELTRRGIRNVYGDLGSFETLHHAGIEEAKLVVCTLPDSILKGTTNERLLRQLEKLCPRAQVIAAAETIDGALELYESGADFVYLARMHSAHDMAEVIETAWEDGLETLRREEIARLSGRREVLG